MNLKEEISQRSELSNAFYEWDRVLSTMAAELIAETYARERAWEAWQHLYFQSWSEEFVRKEFEKWYTKTSTPTGADTKEEGGNK